MNVIRGVGYIRVSTAEQATRGLSLDAQEAEIRAYAKAHGIELFNIYVDAGITARKRLDRREAFGQMMKDVDSGLIDEIIVMRLDRWFRNIYDYHKNDERASNPPRCKLERREGRLRHQNSKRALDDKSASRNCGAGV